MKTGLASFTLFGNDPDDIYLDGTAKNILHYPVAYPDFDMRIYVGKSIPEAHIKWFNQFEHVQIVQMELPEDQSATAWRFLSLRESGYDYYIFRDVDSRPCAREVNAVRQWMVSNRPYHVMRDHPYHNVAMLAGLWGCTERGAEMIRHVIPDRLEGDFYQVDQQFLARKVWRIARRDVMSHTVNGGSFEHPRFQYPFPSVRQGVEFVGEGFYGDDRPRRPDHREMVRGLE